MRAIIIACVSNTVFKFAITLGTGNAALALRCAPAFLASNAGLLLGVLFV